MKTEEYRRWLSLAERHSRRRSDAEDLLQEALLAAVQAGRDDLSLEQNRHWFSGVLRMRAAMIGRTEGRRKRRERANRSSSVVDVSEPAGRPVLPDLPKSERSVAALLVHGMTREEIVCVLGLSPAAFRQRLTSLRRSLRSMPAPDPGTRPAPSDLDLGLLRRALVACLRSHPGVGTHDPDGHLIVITTRKTPHKTSRVGNDDVEN